LFIKFNKFSHLNQIPFALMQTYTPSFRKTIYLLTNIDEYVV